MQHMNSILMKEKRMKMSNKNINNIRLDSFDVDEAVYLLKDRLQSLSRIIDDLDEQVLGYNAPHILKRLEDIQESIRERLHE